MNSVEIHILACMHAVHLWIELIVFNLGLNVHFVSGPQGELRLYLDGLADADYVTLCKRTPIWTACNITIASRLELLFQDYPPQQQDLL